MGDSTAYEPPSQASDSTKSGEQGCPDVATVEVEARRRVDEMLHDLRASSKAVNASGENPETEIDDTLNCLSYQDFPALKAARDRLTSKSKDRKLDVVFRSRITAMVGTLNLHLDPDLTYSWRESSVLAAKATGRSHHFAHCPSLAPSVSQLQQTSTPPVLPPASFSSR